MWMYLIASFIKNNEKNNFNKLPTMQCINNDEYKQSLISGQGYFSSNSKELYFGLKDAIKVDRIAVSWPSGIRPTFQDKPTTQTIYILEGEKMYENTLTIDKSF